MHWWAAHYETTEPAQQLERHQDEVRRTNLKIFLQFLSGKRNQDSWAAAFRERIVMLWGDVRSIQKTTDDFGIQSHGYCLTWSIPKQTVFNISTEMPKGCVRLCLRSHGPRQKRSTSHIMTWKLLSNHQGTSISNSMNVKQIKKGSQWIVQAIWSRIPFYNFCKTMGWHGNKISHFKKVDDMKRRA